MIQRNNDKFLEVTELAGTMVSQEQLERIWHRYVWASNFCEDKDVLEVACGTGQGLLMLSESSSSLQALDCSPEMVRISNENNPQVEVSVGDAQKLPVEDASLDVIIMFEALYYLDSASDFVAECRRALRPGGKVLISNANKDLFDFNPSPHSVEYHGAGDFSPLFGAEFDVEVSGVYPVGEGGFLRSLVRWLKTMVVKLGLMPKTMSGKKLLKRILYGELVEMPSSVPDQGYTFVAPVKIDQSPNLDFKVIYCVATLRGDKF